MNNTSDKFLVFRLNNTDYGIPLGAIKEIIELLEIVPVPQVSEFVKGVINLRGQIIPVIDLRQKLGFDPVPYNERTCIIILETAKEHQKNVGIVVDTVSEVLKISAERIEPAEAYDSHNGPKPLLGIGKTGDKIILILNIESIIDHSMRINLKEELVNEQV